MIKIVSGPLLVERLPDGKRQLKRDLVLDIDGVEVVIPEGFATDYSSWPRLLPGPRYDKIDYAGVVHDYLFKHGTLGQNGPEIGYVDANRIWYKIARSGNKKTKLNPFWAWIGRIGLFVGSWPIWFEYRSKDKN